MPTCDIPPATRISENSKYIPYFADCLGAIDGIYIYAYINIDNQARYRNRKRELLHNVLAVCNFDLLFIYILPDWEESVYDGKVLADAITNKGFNQIPGKYWLGDAGYRDTDYLMTPFRGV